MTSRPPRLEDQQVATVVEELLRGAPLRPGQGEAIEGALRGDTLAVLATGTGKTLIYEVVGRIQPGLTVVVSPTLALQQDQLAALKSARLRAAMLNSLLSKRAQRQVLDDVPCARLQVLLLSPEQLARSEVIAALRATEVGLFVVDEAHCVSSWGHDFRPDYLALASVRAELGRPRALALTATASPRVRTEIIQALEMDDPTVVVGEVDRPNIWLDARLVVDADAAEGEVLRDLLMRADGPGATIVYVASRRRAEDLAAELSGAGLVARPYHGSLARKLRTEVHQQFSDSTLPVVVATSAFGLGIDKPDVRLIVHADPPSSLDAYYQEIGRAGRDGAPARGTLITRPNGYALPHYLTMRQGPSSSDLRAVLRGLEHRPMRAAAVAEAAELSSSRVRRAVNALLAIGAVREDPSGLTRRSQQDDAELVERALELAERHRIQSETAVELVRRYAETTDCRRRLLLQLLGEELDEPCGRCDNCAAGTSTPAPSTAPYPLGSRVEHPDWGIGVVQQYESDRVVVLFDAAGFRSLDLDVVEDKQLLQRLA